MSHEWYTTVVSIPSSIVRTYFYIVSIFFVYSTILFILIRGKIDMFETEIEIAWIMP